MRTPSDDQTPEDRQLRRLGRLPRDVAMVLWPSFLAAGAESLVFFAIFDPAVIGNGSALAELLTNSEAGYALGFAFFWGFTTLAGALTLYLARTETSSPAAHHTTGSPERTR